jgi:dTDP-4-amino-4,6-dideoxygalactose transaminase
LDEFIDQRRALASLYDEALEHIPWIRPIQKERVGCKSAYHLYATLIDEEQLGLSKVDLVAALKKHNIGTQVHYIPIPMQPYYQKQGWSIDAFPGALCYYKQTLSLPLFPLMTPSDVEDVIAVLKHF